MAEDSSWIGPKNVVLARIVEELGCDLVDAERVLRADVARMHPDIRGRFLDWWRNGNIDMGYEVEGWSIRRLIDEGPAKGVLRAFFLQSSLRAAPEFWKEILGRGNRGRNALVRPPIKRGEGH